MSVKLLTEWLVDGWPEEFGTELYNSGWISDGKYKTIEIVIKVESSEAGFEDGYYRCCNHRTGSYYADYEYGDWSVQKVEPYMETITVTKWKEV